MSVAITHLQPMRHYLNLTVRGGVFVRKIVIKDGKAIGVEAESGGKVFTVAADRVVLSAGAIKSPHLLMLGHRPRGPTAALWDPHSARSPRRRPEPLEPLSAQLTFKVKDGISLTAAADAVQFGLHYTSEGSSASNDMVLRTSSVIDLRQERVPGVRTRYLNGDVSPTGWHASRVRSACPTAPATSGWPRPIPEYSRPFTTGISSIPTTGAGCGKACAWRAGCRHLRRIQTWRSTGSTPRMPYWPTTTRWIAGYAKPWAPPGTCPDL